VNALVDAIRRTETVARVGRVVGVRGGTIEAVGPAARVGEVCSIEMAGSEPPAFAEVVGFGDGRSVLMPYGDAGGIAVGARIVAMGSTGDVPVGPGLLGRVVDAFAQPVDDRGPIVSTARRPLKPAPVGALQRARVEAPMATGVKAIDGLLSLAKGQRIGLFAGSGVGKSSLLGMLARGAFAPVNVIALIGERSREVREFVEDQLGPEGLKRSVVVVATSAESAIVRLRAAYAATAIAEHFRDQGQDVLLTMDSLTRFAMARREVGLAAGEPPTARGYTPSVFSEIPQLCERCGPAAASGSITAIYTVLVEGDDLNEPVSDTVRGTLDGHIVLSRDLAHAGHYPAIDVLKSISRLHGAISEPAHLQAARSLGAALSLYERNRQLVEIGAYRPGANPALDRVVDAMPRIEAFLTQRLAERVERPAAIEQLRQLVTTLEVPHGH
jgi:flagellum-specific ATP synthase